MMIVVITMILACTRTGVQITPVIAAADPDDDEVNEARVHPVRIRPIFRLRVSKFGVWVKQILR